MFANTQVSGDHTHKHVRVFCALLLGTGIFWAANAHAVSGPTATSQETRAVPLGENIVEFARAHLGQQVGDGECYDLADEALRHAGARSAPDYGEITGDADYVWGQRVALADAQPGDIVQFHDFTLRTTVISSFDASQRWETYIREHHTSIVERNLGGTLILLEQNVEPGLVVQRTTLSVVSGAVHGGPDGAPGDTVTNEVAGDAWVYRPLIAEARAQFSRHGEIIVSRVQRGNRGAGVGRHGAARRGGGDHQGAWRDARRKSASDGPAGHRSDGR
jgi:hypothetical protein